MIDFYLDSCARVRWEPELDLPPWSLGREGLLRRIRYCTNAADPYAGVSIAWGRESTQAETEFERDIREARGGPVAKIQEILAAAFWRLARHLPGRGFYDVLRAMPQKTHPPEDTLPAGATGESFTQ